MRKSAIVLAFGVLSVLAPGVLPAACEDDLSALNEFLPGDTKLEGETLQSVIDGLAHFEMNQVQDRSKPPSAIAGLKESLGKKVLLVAERSGLSEEAIRSRILETKRILVFGGARSEYRGSNEAQARREREQMFENQPARFMFERVLQGFAGLLVLSPDGRRLMVDTIDIKSIEHSLEFWDLESLDPPIRRRVNGADALAYSLDGTTAISALGRRIQVWDPTTGAERKVLSYPGEGRISSADITRDGRRVVAWSQRDKSQDILIWDVESGKVIEKIPDVFDGLVSGPTHARSLAVDPGGLWISAVTHDHGGMIWKPKKSRNLFASAKFRPASLLSNVDDVFVLPGGTEALTTGTQGEVRIQSLGGSDHLQLLGIHGAQIVAASADAKRAATLGLDGTLRIWDLQERRPAQVIPFRSAPSLSIRGDRVVCVSEARRGHRATIWKFRKPTRAEFDAGMGAD